MNGGFWRHSCVRRQYPLIASPLALSGGNGSTLIPNVTSARYNVPAYNRRGAEGLVVDSLAGRMVSQTQIN